MIVIGKIYPMMHHKGKILVVFCALMSTFTLSHPRIIFGKNIPGFHGILHDRQNLGSFYYNRNLPLAIEGKMEATVCKMTLILLIAKSPFGRQ